MNTKTLTELYQDYTLRPYTAQIVDEMNNHFPNKYVIDIYKNMLELNKEVEKDLEPLEKLMSTYLINNGERR